MDQVLYEKTHDARGQRFPWVYASTGDFLQLTQCDIELFHVLNLFGRLPISHLAVYAKHFGVTDLKYASRRVGWLANEENTTHGGRYLNKSKEQFPAFGFPERSRSLVVELNSFGINALDDHYLEITHGGWYEHQLMAACIASSIYLSTLDDKQFTFYPTHEITREKPLGFKVPFKHDGEKYNIKLTPDYFLGIGKGRGRRVVAIEATRNTEDKRGIYTDRKTLLRCILQYQTLIGSQQLYKKHFGFHNEAILAAFVTTTLAEERALHAIISEVTKGEGCNYILTRCIPEFGGKLFKPPKPMPELFTGAWHRAGRPDLHLNQ